MKSVFIQISLITLLFANSCYKEPIIRFGFDTEFGKNSQGLTIMNVGKNSQAIYLNGNVVLTEGRVLIELINPLGENIFTCHLVSSQYLNVNESFPPVKGNWKLKYKSMEGAGSINLHLNNIK